MVGGTLTETARMPLALLQYSPFSVSRRPAPNDTLVYEGVDFSLIFNLASAFNMSLVPVRDPEATWGAKRHGRWTGIAGMVSRREVDLAVSASFQTPYREKVLDYAHYYYIQVVKFIARAPAEKPRALVVVRPFAVEVWLGVLVAYLVSLALLLAVMRFERRHDRTGKLRFLPTQDVALSLYLGVIWQGTLFRWQIPRVPSPLVAAFSVDYGHRETRPHVRLRHLCIASHQRSSVSNVRAKHRLSRHVNTCACWIGGDNSANVSLSGVVRRIAYTTALQLSNINTGSRIRALALGK
ncbi:uncharacterized protein [Dermacentor andersoni]|uniref:uncharacterized protein isoform X1 n=1 Tax=Dermacentor andersoni TaxID=34620 RepID=UPI0024166723|nr:uncharacterized protein LOC126521575 isoform X1 [Dermacentor andersoni]